MVQAGKERFTGSKAQSEATLPMTQLDALLASLLGCCPVDLLPGATDPTSTVFPQQPLHPCLLPHSARFSTLALGTNPYEAAVGGVKLLGHSGQPVDDICRQTLGEAADPSSSSSSSSSSSASAAAGCEGLGVAPLTALRSTYHWGHLCPTAPDTLPCYPYTDADPFVTIPTTANGSGSGGDTTPTVYFAGNQPAFESSLEEAASGRKTLFVCVPSFRTTRQAVLVNLRTLACRAISFDVAVDDADTDKETDDGGATAMAVDE